MGSLRFQCCNTKGRSRPSCSWKLHSVMELQQEVKCKYAWWWGGGVGGWMGEPPTEPSLMTTISGVLCSLQANCLEWESEHLIKPFYRAWEDGAGSMRQELVVGQSPCVNGACSSVSENLETGCQATTMPLKLFHLRVFSFCSPHLRGELGTDPSLFVLRKSPPPSYLCSRYPRQKAWVGFLYPLPSALQLLLRATRLLAFAEGTYSRVVSEACSKVNDIYGGETVSEPLWNWILVVSWQFCLWYNSDDILAFPVLVYDSLFLVWQVEFYHLSLHF